MSKTKNNPIPAEVTEARKQVARAAEELELVKDEHRKAKETYQNAMDALLASIDDAAQLKLPLEGDSA